MKNIKMFVGLKIPDTTAITAFHTLERMGYDKLKKLKRKIFYDFETESCEEEFKNKISSVDILVNANKNTCDFELHKENQDGLFEIDILVKSSDDDGSSLINSLKSLGINNIKKATNGVLWTMFIEAKDKTEAIEYAEKITKDLLMNEHYQEYRLL